MDRTLTIEALVPGGYTRDELAWRLSTVRKKPVPDATIKRWLKDLRISKDENGLYDDNDLAALTGLVLWLKRNRSIDAYIAHLAKELEKNAH